MSKPGFTLVEAILALGIAAVIGTLLLVIIVNSAGVFYKQSSKVEQGLGVNDALGNILESIKQSQSVAASFQDGAIVYTSGSTQLVLKVPSIDSADNIISSTFDHYVVFLDSSKLRFKIFPDSLSSRESVDQIFSTNVKSLLFQYYDLVNPPQEVAPPQAAKVKITLTLEQKAGAGYEQNTATSEANLRND